MVFINHYRSGWNYLDRGEVLISHQRVALGSVPPPTRPDSRWIFILENMTDTDKIVNAIDRLALATWAVSFELLAIFVMLLIFVFRGCN